jgi:4-hydroxybenzoate polyprenyltransferase
MSIFSRHLIDASHMWAPSTQWNVVSCNTDWPTVLYLFTASDIKTMIFPVVRLPFPISIHMLIIAQTSFAIVAGPFSSWIGLVSTVAWIWIHLLQFNVSNQCGGVEEDTLNKPWRPIPAGHISLSLARQLRWNAAILGLTFSFVFSPLVSWISIVITAATWIYNEAHLSSHWLGKTSCNVVGYVSFQAGAALVMCNFFSPSPA